MMRIKKIIKEALKNDWDWVDDVSLNPFFDPFVVVWIGSEVNFEDIKKLTSLAKDAGCEFTNTWGDANVDIYNYAKRHGDAYFKTFINTKGIKRIGYGYSLDTFKEYETNNIDYDLYIKNPYISYNINDLF